MGIPQDPLPEHADAFARAFPAIADRLAQPGDDPDVERLYEGFTALARRVERVIAATSLRSTLHFTELLSPELLRPFPCATILELASRGGTREAFPAGAEFDSVSIDGARCRFRANAPFAYVPWRVGDAKLTWAQSKGQSLEIGLASVGPARAGEVASAPLPLRLHFMGEQRSALLLLTWLHEHVAEVELDIDGGVTPLERDAVRTWGLRPEQALLPIEPFEHPGMRLLRELMVLPAKFAFVEVHGPAVAPANTASRVVLRFRFNAALPANVRVDADSIRTNCLPVVNVFETTADPVRPSLERPSQPVRPSGLHPKHAEVYAVTGTISLGANGARIPVSPATVFGLAPPEGRGMIYALERGSSRSGPGADVSIAVASSADSSEPDPCVLSIDLWATNRALPASLGVGDLKVAAPASPRGMTFRNVRSITAYRPAAQGDALVWRTLAMGALSARTLANRDSLRTLLHALDLHALADPQAARAHAQRLEAIVGVEVGAVVERLNGVVVRGHDVIVRLTEGAFDGEGEAFLFGQVLARLFAHEASLNAFVRTTVHLVTTGRHFRFPALHGERQIG